MNESLKNPLVLFVVGLLTLWLLYAVLKFALSWFGLFVLAFVALFFFNTRFRRMVRAFFNGIFQR